MSHMTEDTLWARLPQDDNANQLTIYNFKTTPIGSRSENDKPLTQTAKAYQSFYSMRQQGVQTSAEVFRISSHKTSPTQTIRFH